MAMIPGTLNAPGSLLSTHVGSTVPEQMSLQQQANHLGFLIERAHAIIDEVTNVPATPSQNQAESLPLSSALQLAASRADDLMQRLVQFSNFVGHI